MFENDNEPEEVGEHIHLLKKMGYQFIFFEDRLIVGQEYPILAEGKESPYEETMRKVSESLGIHDRKTYEEADLRYNLTMY